MASVYHVNSPRGAVQSLTYYWSVANLDWEEGVQATGGGGPGGSDIQYVEDAATPANPTGTALTVRRRDTLSSEVTTDGDWIVANSTAKGEVYVKHSDAIDVNLQSGAGTDITQTGGALDVNIKSGAASGTEYTEDAVSAADPSGGMLIGRRRDTLTAAEVSSDGDNIALNATNKGQLHVKLADTVTVDGSGVTQPISAVSLPLPSGAATGTKQDTGNTSLASIDGHIDVALSTRLKPADTLAAVTTLGTITNVVHVDDNLGSLTIDSPNLDVALSTRLKPSDTLTKVATVDTITNTVTVGQATGTNLHTVLDSGTLTSITNALPSGTNLLGKVGIDQTTPGTTNKVSIGTDGTVGVTGNVTVVQGTGTNLHVVVDSAPSTAVTVASLPLPSNAAIETGGNLATIASATKVEDVASVDSDRGIPVLLVRQDTLTVDTSASGDYGFHKADSSGRGYVTDDRSEVLLRAILDMLNNIYGEQRVQTFYLQNQLNARDEADQLRSDPYYTLPLGQ